MMRFRLAAPLLAAVFLALMVSPPASALRKAPYGYWYEDAYWTGNKGIQVPRETKHEAFIVYDEDKDVTLHVNSFSNCYSQGGDYPVLEVKLYAEFYLPDQNMGTWLYKCHTMDAVSHTWTNLTHDGDYHFELYLREPHRNDADVTLDFWYAFYADFDRPFKPPIGAERR